MEFSCYIGHCILLPAFPIWQLNPITGQPVDHLIQSVLLQRRDAQAQFTHGNYNLRWTYANELDLVFVAVYMNITQIIWVEEFLNAIRDDFCALYKDQVKILKPSYDYSGRFDSRLAKFEQQYSRGARRQFQTVPDERKTGSNAAASSSTSTSGSSSSSSGKSSASATVEDSDDAATDAAASKPPSSSASSADIPSVGTADSDADAGEAKEAASSSSSTSAAAPSGMDLDIDSDPFALGFMSRRTSVGSPAGGAGTGRPRTFNEIKAAKLASKQGGAPGAGPAAASPTAGPKKGVPGKQLASRADGSATKAEAALLNMSDTLPGEDHPDLARLASVHGEAPVVGEKYAEYDDNDDDIVTEQKSSGSGMWGFLKGLVGVKEVTKEDLAPVAKKFSEQLIMKNVANEIAEKLVDSVVTTLVGKQLGTFDTMAHTVRTGLEEALSRLLTPSKPIDVLSAIAAAKEAERPYSIAFCGVNGVGKSTSLAKIAAYFTSQGLKVGVAACDTFRSGAIEQLRTHCKRLSLPLYEVGYGKDESFAAASAILHAKRDRLDVILLDTAGRMQGNVALMKGLATLVANNNPDLILFVGEALVGNDGCDQLVNFNRALKENSDKQHPRLIDGIVLTKFDTIDDKVGACISMTYSTGAPILFVGTGQTYKDLKRPNTKMLIRALLK